MNCDSFCARRKSISKRASSARPMPVRSRRRVRTAVRPAVSAGTVAALAVGAQRSRRAARDEPGNRVERGPQRHRRVGARIVGQRTERDVDAVERILLGAVDAVGQHGIAQAIGAHAARP